MSEIEQGGFPRPREQGKTGTCMKQSLHARTQSGRGGKEARRGSRESETREGGSVEGTKSQIWVKRGRRRGRKEIMTSQERWRKEGFEKRETVTRSRMKQGRGGGEVESSAREEVFYES
ncbi:hypothetical protein EDB85DRAFT_1896606 [Lactarius pseudohatsudake]|nr:hypothetical protein EDB85DRAFT_1896606 [Lactarius pseudohatsudake]